MMIRFFSTIITVISIVILLVVTPIKGQHYQVEQLEQELLAAQNKPDSIRLQILHKLCQSNISISAERTERYIVRLEELMKKSGDSFFEAEVLSLKAQIDLLTGKTKEAKSTLLAAIKKFSQKDDFVGMAFCHQHLAHYAYQNLQKDSVCYHATTMQQLLKTHAPKKAYHATFMLGNCAAIQHEKNKAISYYKKTKDHALLAGDSLTLARNLNKLAFYSIEQAEFDSASVYIFEAVKIMKKIKANYDLCSAYLTLADIYYSNQDLANTFLHLEKAIKQARLIKSPNIEARVHYHFGYYQLREKQYENAKKHFETCQKLSKQYDLKQNEILSMFGLGNIANAENKLEAAINYYLTAIKLSDEKEVYHLKPQLFLSISKTITNIKSKKNVEVEKIISDILSLSKKEQILTDKYNINLALKNLYQDKNEFKKSLQFASKALEVQESIQKKALTLSINEIELKYENQLKAEELEKQALTLNKHKTQQRIYFFVTLLLASILGIGGLLFISRNKLYQQLKNQKELLESQQNKISNLLEDVNCKNESLEQRIVLQSTELMDYIMSREKMGHQVKEMQSFIKNLKKDTELKPVILDNINSKINNIFDQSSNWLRFKEKINNVYPNFFNNLYSIHPELSKKDLKHCAYILVGLSIKEVCEIMFIAPKTVESSRYRIRKKLNLEATTLLKDYLFSFSKMNSK